MRQDDKSVRFIDCIKFKLTTLSHFTSNLEAESLAVSLPIKIRQKFSLDQSCGGWGGRSTPNINSLSCRCRLVWFRPSLWLNLRSSERNTKGNHKLMYNYIFCFFALIVEDFPFFNFSLIVPRNV